MKLVILAGIASAVLWFFWASGIYPGLEWMWVVPLGLVWVFRKKAPRRRSRPGRRVKSRR